jgi:hypothetical protein
MQVDHRVIERRHLGQDAGQILKRTLVIAQHRTALEERAHPRIGTERLGQGFIQDRSVLRLRRFDLRQLGLDALDLQVAGVGDRLDYCASGERRQEGQTRQQP